MEKVTTLEEAFMHGMSYIRSAENQLVEALPNMAKAASNPKLAQAFQDHWKETREQADRLDKMVEKEGLQLADVTCTIMQSMIEAGDKIIDNIEKGPVRDAVLIAAAQKVEHYEIASYGSLIEVAKKLGLNDVAKLMEKSLQEEKAADEKLSQIAISSVNDEAMRVAA